MFYYSVCVLHATCLLSLCLNEFYNFEMWNLLQEMFLSTYNTSTKKVGHVSLLVFLAATLCSLVGR
jgi:hypothetical protein